MTASPFPGVATPLRTVGRPLRIGLNGAGRIGRTVLRALLERDAPVELVAINDLAPVGGYPRISAGPR